jgi:hypothetical protein
MENFFNPNGYMPCVQSMGGRDDRVQEFCRRAGALLHAHDKRRGRKHPCPFADLNNRMIVLLRDPRMVRPPCPCDHRELHTRMDRLLDELAELEKQIPVLSKQLDGMRHRSDELNVALGRVELADSLCSFRSGPALDAVSNIRRDAQQCRVANPGRIDI